MNNDINNQVYGGSNDSVYFLADISKDGNQIRLVKDLNNPSDGNSLLLTRS